MSDQYLGEIRIFAGPYAPVGWSLCDGTLLPISGNDALYSLLGTTYGGDGRSTFALPDLRGRAPVNQGQGGGLSNVVLGQPLGAESITLNASNIPSHTHAFVASSAIADQTAPAAAANTPSRTLGTFTQNKALNGLYNTSDATAGRVQLNTACVSPSGGSTTGVIPVNNMMPSMPINYIIAVVGVYPTQA